MHSKERGFTLIEIIIVLVLLGILAATAVPKYFDLQKQAYIQAAKAAVAETQARVNLLFGQLLLAGTDMSAGYTISTLYLQATGKRFQTGLADTEYANDTQYASNAGTGRIGGWRVEMKSQAKPDLGFCKKNGTNEVNEFLIYRMVAPDNTIIEINNQNNTPKNATTIKVPNDQKKFFSLYTPECVKK